MSKGKILIVDDESEIRTLLRFVLEKDGYEVSEANNGKVALEALGVDPINAQAQVPDLMILDIMMPVMDGFTANKKMQENDRCKNVPIVVLTARGQTMRELFEVAPNVASYMQKPFEPKILRELVAKIIGEAKA